MGVARGLPIRRLPPYGRGPAARHPENRNVVPVGGPPVHPGYVNVFNSIRPTPTRCHLPAKSETRQVSNARSTETSHILHTTERLTCTSVPARENFRELSTPEA